MKKLVTILAMCLIGLVAQAATPDFEAAMSPGAGVQGEKGGKQFDPAKLSALIQKALTERQAELQKATTAGRANIAAALQKVITDLTTMQTALTNKDRAAFRAANEQRKADREALEQLWKTDRHASAVKTPSAKP